MSLNIRLDMYLIANEIKHYELRKDCWASPKFSVTSVHDILVAGVAKPKGSMKFPSSCHVVLSRTRRKAMFVARLYCIDVLNETVVGPLIQ